MSTQKSLKSGLHALVWKEGSWYVAKCVEVELASQGKTRQFALTNLDEALELYFENEKIKTPLFSNLELLTLPFKPGYA